MLQSHSLKTICSAPLRGQFEFLQKHRTFSSRPRSESEEADLEAARAWFRDFNQSTIPTRISTTTGSRPGGPGGQLANNTDSKATTTWEFDTLTRYVPKVLHEELLGSRYFARRSNTISIQCATHRNKTKNTSETHKRLFEELSRLYKKTVPGTTDPEQKKKVDDLLGSLKSCVGYNPNRQVSRSQHKLERQRLKNMKKKTAFLIIMQEKGKKDQERKKNNKESDRGKPKK